MLRQALLSLVLASAALAGCLAPPETPSAAAEDLEPPVGTTADWWQVNASASPASDLTAFWWRIPEGARVEDGLWGEWQVVPLEVAFVLPEGVELSEWALFAFVEDEEGALVSRYAHVATPLDVTATGIGGSEEEAPPVSSAPVHVRLMADDLKAGDRVGFVLAARADEPVPLALSLRVLPKDPGFTDEASESSRAFLAQVDDRAPIAVAPAARATGHQVALYVELNGFLLPMGFAARSAAVEVEGDVDPDARPLGGIRDMTLAARFPSGGWTEMFALHYGGNGAGAWDAALQPHGDPVELGGRIVTAGAVPFSEAATALVWGFPVYDAVGEGEEESASAFHVELASVNAGGFEVLVFVQIDLGATLGTLLGEASAAGVMSAPGWVAGGRGVAVAGDDLVQLDASGATWVFAGAARHP